MKGFRGCLLVAFVLTGALPVSADTHYVRAAWTNPVSPYTNWITASTNIEWAVNVAANGDTVLVTNGTYGVTNQISITGSVSVLSVNGYLSTTVDCHNGGHAFDLGHSNATIQGLTIVNGLGPPGWPGGVYVEQGTIRTCWFRNCSGTSGNGGGAVYVHTDALIEDCRFSGNSCNGGGGAVFANHATIRDSVFEDNVSTESTSGGGACVYDGVVDRCLFVHNRATGYGGGASIGGGSLRNSVFMGNWCDTPGYRGGAISTESGAEIENCTIVSNSASDGGGLLNTDGSVARNCIIYGNTASGSGSNYYTMSGGTIIHSCVPGFPAGDGNFGGDPLLASMGSTNFQLRLDSPCIDRGTNLAWMTAATDMDGDPRITGSRVDVGAYEIPYVYAAPVGSNTPPYETWAKAATNIQTAVNAFSNYFRVFVTNGTYTSTGEITVAKVIDVSSVNGADATTISGGGAHRCMSVTSNAIIQGFTFTNGYVTSGNGGGLYCENGATVRLCRITGNYSLFYGGGVFFGGGGGALEDSVVAGNVADVNQGGGIYCRAGNTIRNCLIVTNVSNEAGGVMCYQGGLLENCTIVGNVSKFQPGGGVRFYQGTGEVRNCIVYFNIAPSPSNIAYQTTDGTVSFTCTTPAHAGLNNITNDPAFPASGDYHVPYGSACLDVGTNQSWMADGTDLEGYPRIIDSIVDLGAYECTPAHHVSKTGTNDWPFLSSSGGATNVQAGIDAAGAGDTVYVNPGIYAEGATITIPAGCNIELRGIAGADATILDGQNARCVLQTAADEPIIHGFTFRNGYAGVGGSGGGVRMYGGGTVYDCTIVSNCAHSASGGGIYVDGVVVVSNCLLGWNRADCQGGGFAEFGTNPIFVVDCTFVGNAASNDGGGAFVNTGVVDRCVFRENRALNDGGGSWGSCALRDSLFVSNSAAGDGGGIWTSFGALENCTVVGNSAPGGAGGGLYEYNPCTVRNSILVSNDAPSGSNVHPYGTSTRDHNCTMPALGSNCLTNDPRFADAPAGDYGLAGNSPCVNAGTNLDWMTDAADVEGYPRIVDTNADMGAYERTPVHYVDNKSKGTWPYIEPGTGFRDVQAVVDAAHHDDEIRVGSGTYTQGAGVVVSKRLTIRGTNGWASTVIAGNDSSRCFLVTTSAVLDNLTLRGGNGTHGGGAYVTGGGSMRDCLIVSNRAGLYGGGVFLQGSGVLTRCMIQANTAQTNDGGGVYLAGGGFIDSCRILSNTARKAGGIFFDTGGYAINTLVCENDAVGGAQPAQGGGILFYNGGRADHCTVISNTSASSGGGVFCNGGELVNDIVYFNTAPSGPDYKLSPTGTWDHCCTTPAIGPSCVTNDPRLTAGYRLATNSPCLDVALEILSRDIDGMWRPLDSDDSGLAVSDLGAYELLDPIADSDWDGMPDGWEYQYYGSPFGCATPLGNDDDDGVMNRDEAIADTDPCNSSSYLCFTNIFVDGDWRTVQFVSSANRLYTQQYSTNPADPASWKNGPYVDQRGNGGSRSWKETNMPFVVERILVEVP